MQTNLQSSIDSETAKPPHPRGSFAFPLEMTSLEAGDPVIQGTAQATMVEKAVERSVWRAAFFTPNPSTDGASSTCSGVVVVLPRFDAEVRAGRCKMVCSLGFFQTASQILDVRVIVSSTCVQVSVPKIYSVAFCHEGIHELLQWLPAARSVFHRWRIASSSHRASGVRGCFSSLPHRRQIQTRIGLLSVIESCEHPGELAFVQA